MVESGGWVQDFTYLWFDHSFVCLAVVLDLKTRQVVGWRLGTNHTSELTYSAVFDALSKHSSPAILHSDRGSEYLSYKHQLLCERMEITLSCSAKSSPWQNGFMERWFGNFKLELGQFNRCKDLSQLHEAIALQIHYYNTKRIHSALKMSPAAYAASLINSDRLFAEKVAWHLMADHVHMLIEIPPKQQVSAVVGFLKGKSAIAIAREFAGKERNFNGEHFWPRGYAVSTVGFEEAVIRKYISEQKTNRATAAQGAF